MRREIITGLMLLLLIPFYANSQRQQWSFSQCLDTAIRRNISVSQIRLSNELNIVTLEQSKATRIPSLSANMNEGLNIGWSVDPTTNQFVDQAYNSTSMGLTSNLTLFNGLQIRNTIRGNRLDVEAGQYDIEQIKDDVTLSVTTAFLQVLFAFEILDVAQKQVDATGAQVMQTEKMMNAGKVPESNLLQVKAQLASDRLTLINAESQLAMTRVTLMQLMEVPVSDSFDIVRPDLSIPPAELFRTAGEIYLKSLAVMPQIAGASVRTSSALMDIKISKGARWPRLNLGANLGSNYASSRRQGSSVNPQDYPFFEQIWNNLGQSFNFSLSIPIYSNRQIKSNIDRATINSLNARLSEQNIKNQLRKSIEQTYTDLKSAMRKFEATQEQLAAAEASYKSSDRKFEVGLMDAITFLIEKNNYYKAQSNLLQAKYDFIFKRKILDFYLGNPITF
jgi:outer membrane protein